MKIDIGCGTQKQPDHVGVDAIAFPGVDVVLNAGKDRWPWEECTVDEARASHFVEHLEPAERRHFVNELQRVLKTGGKCQIIVPHWSSSRAYGDLTHKWPPVVEFWFYYLNADWRKANAPHETGYTCNFDVTMGYGINPALTVRSQEFQTFAVTHYKEAASDLIATVIKR